MNSSMQRVRFALASLWVVPGAADAQSDIVGVGALLAAVAVGAAVALGAVAVARTRRGQRELALLKQALATSADLWWMADRNGRITDAGAGTSASDPAHLVGRSLLDLIRAADAREKVRADLAAARPFANIGSALDDGDYLMTGRALARASTLPAGTAGFAGTLRKESAAEAHAPIDAQAAELRAELEHCTRQLAEQSRQLQHAAGELDSLAHSVSHDLRAPLRVVDGFATIVLEDYGDRGKPLDDVGRDHLRRIVAASQRMNTMIDTLLNLSRMTSRELVRERVDLSRIARELADDLAAQDAGRQIEFVIGDGIKALGDPTLLRLVLQNLLGNAHKFCAKQRAAKIEFGCRHEAGAILHFVRDNGAGFDMRFAEKLFGLFHRLHSANEFPGSGVGLATVQKIIRRHQGRIWAEAIPAPAEGHGATFYFTLWEKA